MTTLARSAPEKPGVPRAITARSTLRRERHFLGVDLQDHLAPFDIGTRHHHLAVETAGTEQGRVEHVGPVGGGDQDDPFVGLEAVHLHQELVEGLLALVMAASQTGAAMAADGVDLIDEDDAGGAFLRLHEQVAHPAGADADKHLDKVGAGDGEERNARFAGNGAGQQGLAGARRTDQEHPFGDSCRPAR